MSTHVLILRGPSSAAPTPDILWWKFTDGSGTTVTADVGPNGTLSGGYSWVTGKSGSGYAVAFDGVDAALISASNVTYGTDVVTVTCWVKCPQAQVANNWIHIAGADGYIKSSSSPGWVVGLKGGYSQNLEGIIKSSSWGADDIRVETDDAGLFPDDTWTHLAMVFDAAANSSAGDVKIYVNGSLATTTVQVNTKTVTANYTANRLLVMKQLTNPRYTEGSIDDLRIYSGELTSTQIAAVYAEEY